MTSPVVHRNGRRGTATGRCSPYDSSLIEVEWDDGYVTGELPEDITQEGESMTTEALQGIRRVGIFDLLSHFSDAGYKQIALDPDLYRLLRKEMCMKQSFFVDIGLRDEIEHCGMRVICGDK